MNSKYGKLKCSLYRSGATLGLILSGWVAIAGSAIAHPGQKAPEDGKFWAFRAPKPVDPPSPDDKNSWIQNEVDQFILAKLKSQNINPAKRADKATLLRRAYFDLTGLPPTTEQYRNFMDDSSPAAYSKLIEQLLASKEYGERWGRHWLDLARYADTTGDATDMPIPEAYLYRDYVISAFNEDLPYDQFLIEQLAGDQLNSEYPKSDRWKDRIIATGYVAMAQRFGNSKFASMHLIIENTLETIGKSMMGMSLACARCHDHKFDPITMEDYYGLYGYFSGTRYPHAGTEHARYRENYIPLESDPEKRKSYQEWNKRLAKIKGDLRNAERAFEKNKNDASLKEKLDGIKAELKKHNENIPTPITEAWAVIDGKTTGDVKMHMAGDPNRKGELAPRGFLRAITNAEAKVTEGKSGRLELARWIASKDNPLTKRVMTNRIWQYHFGRGLVETSNLFGAQGNAPSHPDLLNWLAEKFIEEGWSIKAMHRLMMNSATYQQAATTSTAALETDPNNTYWGRWTRRRLEGEAIRDSMLLVSGLLDRSPGGAHPFPKDSFKKYSQGGPFKSNYSNNRRTVYQMVRRNGKDDFWELFDAPDRNQSTSSRRSSTVPMQALFMMNSEFVRMNAEAFVKRLSGNDAERVKQAIMLAYGREPQEDELTGALLFLRGISESDSISQKAWISFCRSLLASNEFIYFD